MKTSEFDFHLPDQLVAQHPAENRDGARLLAVERSNGNWSDRTVRDLPELLQPGDLLVLNDTRVIPARLRATRDSSGGKVEILLLPPEAGPALAGVEGGVVRRVLMKSGGRIKPGETLTLRDGPRALLLEQLGEAGYVLRFSCDLPAFNAYLSAHGEVPLPPYIRRGEGPSAVEDVERYQTVFAKNPGAVAAPTAGLHFTPELLAALDARGVERVTLTLHVGPGTFRPVKAENVEEHFIDPEPYYIPAESVAAIRRALSEKRRIVPVGTTSLRTLEGAAERLLGNESGALAGATGIYIFPPFRFQIAGGLLTNFHIPKSSLLMLVSAFAAPESNAGVELTRRAYEHAVASRYRFYSYGDACLFL